MAKLRPLQCPFCDNFLIKPVDINFKTMSFSGGICKCRSVYVLDRSGRNLGESFMDGLTFVCMGDYDRAMNLDPEEYESVEYDYDLNTNTLGSGGAGHKLSKLVFIRLRDPG